MKKFLAFSMLLTTGITFAQKINKELLHTTWCLDKYSDASDYYQPPRKEVGDYISLKRDMTYEVKSEGETSTGTWMLNMNGNYIEMRDENVTEKLYIQFLSERSLVVVYDVDEYRIWEVHYVSCK